MTPETSIYEYARHGLELSETKTALWFYGKSITYRELFEKIDNTADHLYSLGVREGSVVTVHLPNCPQAVIAIYAIAKLGAICNMVHAQTPAAALRENMAFTESELLITYLPDCTDVAKLALYVDISHYMGFFYRTGFRMKSKNHCPKGVRPFEELARPCTQKAVLPEQKTLAGKCAFYLHSAGTTGLPKTVMHSHTSINKIVANTYTFLHCDNFKSEVVLAELPLFHGFGLIDDHHAAICGGGTIVQMVRWDLRLAIKLIKKYKVTFIAGVPKIYRDFLDNSKFDGSSLKHCYVGGEGVDELLKKEFNAKLGRSSLLYEGYGLTETVAYCCSNGPYCDNIKSSGYPMPNCELAVITDQAEYKSVGRGELIVSSDTIMLGYYKDELATNDSFVQWNGKRWLKTCDRGFIDDDGWFYYEGRLKDTIVYNGYNIYPYEIEAITRRSPMVDDACVVGVRKKDTATQIVRANVLIAPGTVESEVIKELNDMWKKYLPHYSIPQEIRFFSEFPRTPMGKIDRHKLEQLL